MVQQLILLLFYLFCRLCILLPNNNSKKCVAWSTKVTTTKNTMKKKNNVLLLVKPQQKLVRGHRRNHVNFYQCATSHPDILQGDSSSDFGSATQQSASCVISSTSSFLIHKGRSTKMIRRSPAIQGGALCKGWTEATTKAFDSAIRTIVERNPILTGHVYDKKRNLLNSGELWIDSGTYTPDNHEFVKYIDAPPNSPNFAIMNATGILDYCVGVLLPLLNNGGSELTEKQIQNKLPLFATSLMVLPDGYAFYSIKLSHAVGDGVTFFQLMQEISMLMNGHHQPNNNGYTPSLEWNNPLKPTHEFYPDAFSPGDVEKSYGLPFMCGLLKNFPTLTSRKQNILLLCKKKINQKKREYRFGSNGSSSSSSSSNQGGISSNDIITAALCEANESSDIFVFTENIRGIKDGVPRNASGNFFWEVPVSKSACANNPRQVRASVTNGGYYPTDELPLQPFLCGKVGRLTSLATITHTISYPGTETVCQLPFLSFIQEIPLDVAVIFRFSDQYWGVLHNFSRFRISGLLSEIVVS